MDYLLRDSFFTGVKYGTYDLDWIVENLGPAEVGDKVHLALAKGAVFAFEDFLLSRFHMFVSVYYHHTAVCFDELLRRYYADAPGEFEVPSDPEEFLHCDDVELWHTLRRSKNRWAYRITRRRPFTLLAQLTDADRGYDLAATEQALTASGIEHVRLTSQGVLSKYFLAEGEPGLYVSDRHTGRLTPIVEYTPLYQRYAAAVRLERLYCDDGRAEEARAILRKVNG